MSEQIKPTDLKIKKGARILRASSRNAFIVIFDETPCICEVKCSTIDAGDRREFNKRIRGMPHPIAMVPSDVDDLIRVDILLGRYCIASRAWVGCTIRYEPTP